MRVKILTNTPISTKFLDELKSYVPDWDITVTETTDKLPTKFNPYFNTNWGDFDWLRNKVGQADIRVFATTATDLKNSGITTHWGMYDLVDKDAKLDYYIGIPNKLDKRATANGFKSNFAWLMVHEYLHGEEKQSGTPDRVHDMEAQGRLVELLREHQNRRKLLLKTKNLLETIVGLYKAILAKKPQTGSKYQLKPLVDRIATELIEEMAILGHPIRITEGYRSPERQNDLYAQGRSTPGNIVTNAKAGESFHNYGVAFDVVFVEGGYSVPEAQWQRLGLRGEKLGLEWGGRWVNFVDRPHFEMKLGYTLKDFQIGKVDYSRYM